jgi:integrase
MSAWLYQDDKQLKKVGPERASWYVGWIDPDGKRRCKSFGRGAEGKKLAFQFQRKVEAELLTGTYQSASKKTWAEFRAEFEAKVMATMGWQNRKLTEEALDQFERLMTPQRIRAIKSQTIAEFVVRRSQDRGKKKGETVSPATVNKDLRHIRAVLRVAYDWKYLPEMPKVRLMREGKKLPTFVTPEHFAALYQAADAATMPGKLAGIAPADWWRALLVFAYMTGWRISEVLALMRSDLDVDAATAVTRAEDNKGKRDERISLHPVVVEHLRRLTTFDPHVFPWPHDRRTLYVEFARLHDAAGVHLPCSKKHEHTDACHHYGFHDLRRAFATQNAKRLTADALQKLMRHKSYQTTQRYIEMTSQMAEAVAVLHVPEVLKARTG